MMSTDEQGAFDNYTAEAAPGEYLGRQNTLVLLAAVKTQWGPGISYFFPGPKMSVFTNSLLSFVDKYPGRGLPEIFLLVMPDVLTATHKAGLMPPQFPYELNSLLAGNLTLADFAHPPPPLTGLLSVELSNYVSGITAAQLQSLASSSAMSVSAPIDPKGFSVAGLTKRAAAARAAVGFGQGGGGPPGAAVGPFSFGPIRVKRQSAASSSTNPILKVSLVARFWDPQKDIKKYGTGGAGPSIPIPNISTESSLVGSSTQFTNRVLADSGFRITKIDAAPIEVTNVRWIKTKLQTDEYGVTSESIVWSVPNSGDRPNGTYSAVLSVVEKRPQGTQFRRLKDLFELHQNQSLALPLQATDVDHLDVLQLLDVNGHVITELQRETSKIVKEVGWWFSLQLVNGHLLLQTASASDLK
jgi:hypothetical protein